MVEDDSDDDSDEEETNAYKDLKKHELRQECIKRNIPASGSNKILVKRLMENDDISKKVQSNHPEKLCESCAENPMKMHLSSISKWFCSEIRPYGTILMVFYVLFNFECKVTNCAMIQLR